MRSYILTEREREIVNAFLKTKDVPKGRYGSWCQLRFQTRKHLDTIKQDLKLIEEFMDTNREPECFGSDDVMQGEVPKKCLECDAEGKCIEAYCRRTGIRP